MEKNTEMHNHHCAHWNAAYANRWPSTFNAHSLHNAYANQAHFFHRTVNFLFRRLQRQHLYNAHYDVHARRYFQWFFASHRIVD